MTMRPELTSQSSPAGEKSCHVLRVGRLLKVHEKDGVEERVTRRVQLKLVMNL